MSLRSRLAGAAKRIAETFSRDKELKPNTSAELLERWTNPPPRPPNPMLPEHMREPKPPAPPREQNPETLQGVFDKYVPEDDWDNKRVRKAFDKGFGSDMGVTNPNDVRHWRAEFLQYLHDEGIDLEDFYPDWREAYEDA